MPIKKRPAEDQPWGEAILRLLAEQGRPLPLAELAGLLQVKRGRLGELKALLKTMLEQGLIRRSGRSALKLPDAEKDLTGLFKYKRSGQAYVSTKIKNLPEINISRAWQNEAWPGDLVSVGLLPKKRPSKNQTGRRARKDLPHTAAPEGRVLAILERDLGSRPGRIELETAPGQYLVSALDPAMTARFVLDAPTGQMTLAPGQAILFRPIQRLGQNLWSAEAIKELGAETDPRTQEYIVKAMHGIPLDFTGDVLADAAQLPADPTPADVSDRRDLRHLDFVTIDGDMARDFDDAIYVQQNGPGFDLHVAIADVAHYVKRGSILDREAEQRGNSYYFPLSVAPMFPEALSNGLCSLKPGQDRLAMVVHISFDQNGQVTSSDFCQAVIRSRARLTYDHVFALLEEKKPLPGQTSSAVPAMLALARQLAAILQEKRRRQGSLDLDLPDPEIVFSSSQDTFTIRPAIRNFAHRLIEEFMIAANEAVAAHLTANQRPFLYRVHAQPDQDKLAALFRLLAKAGLPIKMPRTFSSKHLQAMLDQTRDTTFDFLAGRMLLRTMMQARYQPDNIGHFALASPCYCHFTSPIRRYADLVVHRALKAALEAKAPGRNDLTRLGEHLGACERRAMEAERDIQKRLAILYLKRSEKKVFPGVINMASDFGLWVEITEIMAEGLILLSSLKDDYYTFLPDRQELIGSITGRIFRIGQELQVRVIDANLDRQEITLLPADVPQHDWTGPLGRPAAKTQKNQTPRHRQSKSQSQKRGTP